MNKSKSNQAEYTQPMPGRYQMTPCCYKHSYLYPNYSFWQKTKCRMAQSRLRHAYKKLYRWCTALDYSRIDDIEVQGIESWDYPDFCDAFISSATYKGREMSERELERLNEDSGFVYDQVIDKLF